MNQRLKSAPLTDEDRICWLLYACRRWDVPHEALWVRSVQSDRRDAYVMLFLEASKANGCHETLTRAGQIYGFIGSFVRMPAVPPREEDYA